jgi:hypothetical protein
VFTTVAAPLQEADQFALQGHALLRINGRCASCVRPFLRGSVTELTLVDLVVSHHAGDGISRDVGRDPLAAELRDQCVCAFRSEADSVAHP